MISEVSELVEVTYHSTIPHHCVVTYNHGNCTYGVVVENVGREPMAKFENLSPKEFLACVRDNTPVQAITPLRGSR